MIWTHDQNRKTKYVRILEKSPLRDRKVDMKLIIECILWIKLTQNQAQVLDLGVLLQER